MANSPPPVCLICFSKVPETEIIKVVATANPVTLRGDPVRVLCDYI
jgi:hypothetical protein